MVKHNANDCVNLPVPWRNRVSSILTNYCVVLYTDSNCIYNTTAQLFNKPDHPERFYDIILSQPNTIPNNNFFKTM